MKDTTYTDREYVKFTDQIAKNFQIKVQNTNEFLYLNSLTKERLNQPDFSLASGQLTSIGFKQHFDLGIHLRKAYEKYLYDISRDDLYIRSTNYDRTIQVSPFN
jgi:hypothetical protein